MLTDERISSIWIERPSTYDDDLELQLRYFARAIEAEVLQAQEPVARANDAVKMRFFRDMTSSERRKVFEVFGIESAVLNEVRSLSVEAQLFKHLFAAPQPPAPCPKCDEYEARINWLIGERDALQAKVAEHSAEIERLTADVSVFQTDYIKECELNIKHEATIAQQVSEIETWRMRFYEADNHRITAASKVADQEQLKRTIEQQAERIAELEQQRRQWLDSDLCGIVVRDQEREITAQSALIEKCEKFAADIPGNGSLLGFVSESARLDVLAAIAAQKGGA